MPSRRLRRLDAPLVQYIMPLKNNLIKIMSRSAHVTVHFVLSARTVECFKQWKPYKTIVEHLRREGSTITVMLRFLYLNDNFLTV